MVAIYSYNYRDTWDADLMRWSFKRRTLRVEILEELPHGYRVKFLQHHVDGRQPGTVTTVQTKSIKHV